MGNAHAIATPIVEDETLHAMNARLGTFVDHRLGFGVLEATTKQKLIALPVSPSFCHYVQSVTVLQSVENTTTLKGAMDWEQIARAVPVAGKVGLQTKSTAKSEATREESAMVFHFKRIIAKRSMAAPSFSDLLPVKANAHVDGDRWLVELYGNQICTTEYYGGEASIAFRWNHDAKVSTATLKSAIESAFADAKGSRDTMQSAKLDEFSCRADVKGFKLPDRIRGNMTTMVGVMELIRELTKLPIERAHAVQSESIPIENTSGFLSSIHVETHIRENETLKKLTQVELQLGTTEPLNKRALDFVKYLKNAVEDASMRKRLLLPPLRDLADTVTESMAQHGKRVELYSRHKELRLLTDNCDANSVTASASETLSGLTLGLAVPVVRYQQYVRFEAAPVWTVPAHYKAHKFVQTYAVCGYYDRVKMVLCFNDNALIASWRKQTDQLIKPQATTLSDFLLQIAMLVCLVWIAHVASPRV